jgi:hypothetical protein
LPPRIVAALRRLFYRREYHEACEAYWAAQNMTECRAAHRALCWFGNDGGFGAPL